MSTGIIQPRQRRPGLRLQLNAGSDLLPLVVGVAITGIAMLAQIYYVTALGLGLAVYCTARYIEALGKEIAIVPVISMVAALQWIVGPYLAYYFEGVTAKYYMYVSEQEYMRYVVPAMYVFVLVTRLFAPEISVKALREYLWRVRPVKQQIILLVIALSLIAEVVGRFMPAGIAFVFVLLGQLKHVGVIYMLIYRYPLRWWATGFVFLLQINAAAAGGFFHDLILWSALILSYVCLDLKLNRAVKLIAIVIGTLAVIQVQQVKSDYRMAIQNNPSGGSITALTQAIMNPSKRLDGEESGLGMLNARLNQGWIISAIMSHVPASMPHEEGATVVAAVTDSLLPRFLVADKRKVNMGQNFEHYTGLTISEGTTFGISILGEAWINFGYWGILFMGAWGGVFAFVLRVIVRFAKRNPTLILWTPLLFLQAVKAETEIAIVLNHMVKASVFILMFYAILPRLFRIKI